MVSSSSKNTPSTEVSKTFAHANIIKIVSADIFVKTYISGYGKLSSMAKEKAFDIELFFRALADKTRLRLINLMRDDEVCVCFFVEVIRAPQPKISRHLAYLKKAGIVGARRDGKWMHYQITEPKDSNAARVFRELKEWLRENPEMQKDRERLVKVCCAPSPPITIQGAPRPASIAA
jgi:ArsR family transcriptional regulator